MLVRYPDPQDQFSRSWSASLIRSLEERDRATELPSSAQGQGEFVVSGAKGDDSTDDHAPIQTAVNAAMSSGMGGVVRLGRGIFRISAPIAWDGDRITFEGHGGSTRIRPTGAFNAFSLTGTALRQHNSIRHLHIDPVIAGMTSGVGVSATNQFMFGFEDIFIYGMPFGMELNSCTLGTVRNVTLSTFLVNDGIGLLINGGNDHYISETFMVCAPGSEPKCGVLLKKTDATWMNTVGALTCNIGCLVQPGSGDVVQQCFTSRCAWDTGASHGVLYAPVGTGVIRTMHSDGDWSATNALNGVAISAGSGTVDGLTFTGFRSLNNGENGMALLACSNVSIGSKSVISGNSQSSFGAHDGVSIAAGVSDFSITDNDIKPWGPFPNSQRYAVNIAAGASDRYMVRMNRVTPSVTGGVLDGGTGVNKSVGDNL